MRAFVKSEVIYLIIYALRRIYIYLGCFTTFIISYTHTLLPLLNGISTAFSLSGKDILMHLEVLQYFPLLRFYPRASRRNICLFRSVGHSGAFNSVERTWESHRTPRVFFTTFYNILDMIYIVLLARPEMNCAATKPYF